MASNFVKKLDKWCDNQWILFLCVTATVVAVLSAIFWDVMPLGSKAGVFVAFIMAFHVLEEWKFPLVICRRALKIMLRIHFMVKVKWKLKNVLKRRILNILGLLYVLRLFGDHGLENLMISSFVLY